MKAFSSRQVFRFTFASICMVCVAGMIYYWVYKFLVDDRDIGSVDYEDVPESEMKLPVGSICVQDPFLENKIELIDPEMNGTTYLKHLKGEIYEERFENIDHENVTLNLDNYLTKIRIDFRNGSNKEISNSLAGHEVTFNGFYYENWFLKCFAYHLDEKTAPQTLRVTYVYDKNLFFKDFPGIEKQQYRSSIWMHYPGQILLRFDSVTFGIRRLGRKSIYITEIEFLQDRRKRTRDCEENWKSYDWVVLKQHAMRHECVAPYHKSYNLGPICKDKTKIKEYLYHFEIVRDQYKRKACTRISKLGALNYPGSPGEWMVSIKYPNFVKTINQAKEVDFHTLIGNIGGYIGLFLGNIQYT